MLTGINFYTPNACLLSLWSYRLQKDQHMYNSLKTKYVFEYLGIIDKKLLISERTKSYSYEKFKKSQHTGNESHQGRH